MDRLRQTEARWPPCSKSSACVPLPGASGTWTPAVGAGVASGDLHVQNVQLPTSPISNSRQTACDVTWPHSSIAAIRTCQASRSIS
ncbi:hypothetical protein BaRGS_00007412 [Batillaria attramentaria]|uniref:Uncharacterized protein n=1 Tax=Batillaria attramentaria TaxID=370345 RepID=A0ABD0LNX4_9CAEN